MSDQPDRLQAETEKQEERGASPTSDRKVDRKLLEILVCPVTKGPLEYRADTQELISVRADLVYPIHDGVPLMTPEAARPLTEAERARIKATKR